ncbi:MAG: hypothetical protein H8E66_03580 [Planctomycetes bacterium]|nr:hypothetical protein [Planctomycetota bacterium]
MSRLTQTPLESYTLAHYAVDVPCFVCEGGNRHDAERCRHCYAPMALTYQVTDKRSTKPQVLAVIGPRGAGKTSYLGMLCDSVLRQQDVSQTVARGAFSVSLQQQVISRLVRQKFPMATPEDAESWNWNHLQVVGSNCRRTRELIFPDISGAVMEREFDDGASPITRAFLKRCTGAIVLLDTQRIDRGDPTPDFFAMKLLSYLCEFGTKRSESWRHKPIAFLFTKADRSQVCMESPREYAETYAQGAFRQATSSLKRFKFFASSVAGASINLEIDGAPVSLPLRVEPRGIREPFDWMLNQLG